MTDGYVWLRWRGDVKPDEFEFMNGKMDVKEHPDAKEVGGVKYVSYHCRGSFHTCLDFHKYPLDSHTLEVDVEDALHDTKELQYVVDNDPAYSHPIQIDRLGMQSAPLRGAELHLRDELWRSDPVRFTDGGLLPLLRAF